MMPISVYLLLIGSINLTRRPFLTTGTRDLFALALAISGFVVVGPLELFLPESVASILGGWVWVLLLLLYVVLVTMVVLFMRPRLVIYNITKDQLVPVLSQTVAELDSAARWAGDAVILPHLGVQLAVESYPGMRNVSLVSVGSEQDLEGWYRLRHHLEPQLTHFPVPVNTHGFSFVFLSVLLAGAIVYSLLVGKQEIAQAMQQMLRM